MRGGSHFDLYAGELAFQRSEAINLKEGDENPDNDAESCAQIRAVGAMIGYALSAFPTRRDSTHSCRDRHWHYVGDALLYR